MYIYIFIGFLYIYIGFPSGSVVKNLPGNAGTWAQSLGQEDTLGEEMAALFSILAGIIPQTEQLGGD